MNIIKIPNIGQLHIDPFRDGLTALVMAITSCLSSRT